MKAAMKKIGWVLLKVLIIILGLPFALVIGFLFGALGAVGVFFYVPAYCVSTLISAAWEMDEDLDKLDNGGESSES